MVKIQPAVKTLTFIIEGNTPENQTVNFVDLSQCASIVNRRAMRQGLNWVVSGIKFTVGSGYQGTIHTYRLPETWCVSNSWHKTFAAWQKQAHEAIKSAGAESTVARYRDFKIFMNTIHQASGFPNNLIPYSFTPINDQFDTGEWEPSQIVIPNDGGVVGNTVEYNLHMVGADSPASFGMIKNYELSRSVPHSPDPVDTFPASGMLSEMFNVGMDDVEVVTNAIQNNDELPYDQFAYPGGSSNGTGLQLVDTLGVNANAVANSRLTKGDTFPCGLLNVVAITDLPSTEPTGKIQMTVYLVPGASRGYLTQPMQDM